MPVPKARDERVEKALALFKQGMKLVDIAQQLGVKEGTVRSWKNRYEWNATLRKNECNVALQKESKKRAKKEDAVTEVKEILENDELTDKQRLFCIYYIRCFNATKAYQKAYGCSYEVAAVNGSRMLRNAKIKEEIFRLKQDRMNREFLSEADIFQKYMDIAFADMTDYAEFGNDTFTDPDTGEKVPYSFVNLKDSKSVDGTLISEVSKGKDGAKIKLADKMKALQWLSDHMDLATEEQRYKIAVMKSKVQGMDDDEQTDDGFIEALNGTASKDWADEE